MNTSSDQSGAAVVDPPQARKLKPGSYTISDLLRIAAGEEVEGRDDDDLDSGPRAPCGLIYRPRYEYDHKRRAIIVNTEQVSGHISVSSLRTRDDFLASINQYAKTFEDRVTITDAIDDAFYAHFNPFENPGGRGEEPPTCETLFPWLEKHPKMEVDWPQADELPQIVSAAQLCESDIETPPEVVYGLLHQGSKMVLGGGSKSFKTWTLLDLALSVSHGEPWLSLKTSRGRTLYLNFELPAFSFRNRIMAVCDAKRIRLDANQFDIWNLRGYSEGCEKIVPKIAKRAAARGYTLIVLDPLYKLLGELNENDAGDMGNLANWLENLAQSTNAAIAFGAHFSKGNQSGKQSIDRISGSGVIGRDSDSLITFTEHRDAKDAFAVEVTLRNLKPIEPFVVQWSYPLFRRNNDLDPSRLKPKGGREKEYSADEILECLSSEGASFGEWLSLASERTGIKKATFDRVRKGLQQSGKIVHKDGKWMLVSNGLKTHSETSETAGLSHGLTTPLGCETETSDTVLRGISKAMKGKK